MRETVRRQLTRPFSQSAEREEEVIRHRIGAYCQLPAMKVETFGPIDAVVDSLLVHLRHTNPLASAMKVAAWQAPLLGSGSEDVFR